MTLTHHHAHAPAGGRTTPIASPVLPTRSQRRPLGLDEVRILGGFWGRMQATNGTATLDHLRTWLEREGWLGNFDLAAEGLLPAGRRGREFSDSEVYKYLEALAWEIGRTDDAGHEVAFRSVVARVAAAQEPDGYLNTRFGRPGQAARWSDLEWGHELYCAGHLFQAAVARERTRPGADDGLLEIATRYADLICDVFGQDGVQSVCGHAEVETALVELGRATGRERYIVQAQRFVERRGHHVLHDIEWGRSYFQDDVPVRDADVMRGHAVRANYLASGAADVAHEAADDDLLAALRTQWENTIAARTYITGGQGSHHQDEGFGADFELPADRAYSETCAAIASIQFTWRLLLEDPRPEYGDLIERTLYNVLATSPGSDGRSFYYANTLHQRVPGHAADPDEPSPRAQASLRAPWFEVSCCPPNIARTLASLDSYLATLDDNGVQLHQYAPATLETLLPSGERIGLAIDTEYPSDGRIRIRPTLDAENTWTLSLRVPDWADGATLTITGPDGTETRSVDPGTVEITRRFTTADLLELALPLQPRFIEADPRVDAVRGCVAVTRGPEVFALESVDLPAGIHDVADIVVDTTLPPSETGDDVVVTMRKRKAARGTLPYSTSVSAELGDPVEVRLVRYHDWAERGPSTMRIWLPVA